MEYFVEDEIDRFKLDDDCWIDIKRRMSTADLEEIAVSSPGEQVEARIVSTLVVNIKAWNLKGKDGKEQPLDREHIGKLELAISLKLFVEIGKRNVSPKA